MRVVSCRTGLSLLQLCSQCKYALVIPKRGHMNTNPLPPPPYLKRLINIEKDKQIRRCLDESINPRVSPYPPRTQDRKYLQWEFDNPAGAAQRRIDRKRSLDTNDMTDPEVRRRPYNRRYHP